MDLGRLCVVTTQVPRGRIYPSSGRTGGGDGARGGSEGEKKWGGSEGGRTGLCQGVLLLLLFSVLFLFCYEGCCVITGYGGTSQLN